MAAFRGIAINMATRTVIDPWGGTDRFTGIEEVFGSRFNDSFTGSAGRDRFAGLRGNDTFNGGADRDTIDYAQDRWYGGQRGIVVDLQTSIVGTAIRGTITDGFGNTDKTVDIERVIGTSFNDVFGNTENALNIEDVEGSGLKDRIFGNLNANWITGDDGADTMFGGNGADHFEWWDQSQFGMAT